MENIYKPNKFASMLSVSVITLQRWDNDGKLVAYRNPKGRRYYTETQYREYMGIPKENQVGKTILYARVSNSGQKKDLENQVEFLRTFANARGWIVDLVLTDTGSGLNYKRKKWNDLLDMAQKKEVKKVLISHKDRFVRFGYDWFEGFLQKCGVEIVVVNNDALSPQEELIQDLISIIHVFSCRIYGLREYKKKLKEDEEL